MKMGRLDESHIDLENVVRKEPENEEANRLYSMIDTLKENLANAISYLNWNNYDQAIELFGELLEVRKEKTRNKDKIKTGRILPRVVELARFQSVPTVSRERKILLTPKGNTGKLILNKVHIRTR